MSDKALDILHACVICKGASIKLEEKSEVHQGKFNLIPVSLFAWISSLVRVRWTQFVGPAPEVYVSTPRQLISRQWFIGAIAQP
jgi:hypothetical protein